MVASAVGTASRQEGDAPRLEPGATEVDVQIGGRYPSKSSTDVVKAHLAKGELEPFAGTLAKGDEGHGASLQGTTVGASGDGPSPGCIAQAAEWAVILLISICLMVIGAGAVVAEWATQAIGRFWSVVRVPVTSVVASCGLVANWVAFTAYWVVYIAIHVTAQQVGAIANHSGAAICCMLSLLLVPGTT